MKIAFLTSSRADFGIYLPLLKELNDDPFFVVRVIAFGTHLSDKFGNTIAHIKKEGFTIDYEIETLPDSDSDKDIATSIGHTIAKFSSIWESERKNYDLIFALGDRYEMFAATTSSVPFNIPVAHIHGGETTHGAIDDVFRDCITHMASLHFTATEENRIRVLALVKDASHVYNTGALSLDNLTHMSLMDTNEMWQKYKVDFTTPTILVTYHPETVGKKNIEVAGSKIADSLYQFRDFQIVITMPNADAKGDVLRKIYYELAGKTKRVHLIESFGTRGYFSAMHLSKIIVGNSSSGIIEAASCHKYVVNVGDRQKGRITSGNVIHVGNDGNEIVDGIKKGLFYGDYTGDNKYYNGGAAKQIINGLRKWTLRSI